MYFRFKSKKEEDFGVKVISVGNLSVGGSGKTPLVTALAAHYQNSAIVLRGYGRDSKGLHVVKDKHGILCDVKTSGDEAMIYAKKLHNTIVIVSEDRKKGIVKAKEMGAKIIFLDDAYSKHDIKKLDLLIEVKTTNNRCFPSGAFREKLWQGKKAIVLKDGIDFKRVVEVKNATKRMSLVTAIARPQRLDLFLPEVLNKNYFPDHHSFSKQELENIFLHDNAESLLVTYKDFVKVESFGMTLSLLDLHVEVEDKVYKIINNYLKVS